MEQIPDYFIDGFNIRFGPFGVTLIGNKSMPQLVDDKETDPSKGLIKPIGAIEFADQIESKGQVPTVDQCVLRFSVIHSKVLTMILRRAIKAYEKDAGGPVPLAEPLLKKLNLTNEEW